MSELLIIIPVMGLIGAIWTLRQWRRDYPLSTGAVDYKRIAWPVGKSGLLIERDGQSFIAPRLLPPQSVTSDVTDEMIASNNAAIIATGLKLVEHGYLTEEQLRRDLASVDIVLPVPSTDYTPLLDDDPYEASEPVSETWNEALLKLHTNDLIEVDLRLSYWK